MAEPDAVLHLGIIGLTLERKVSVAQNLASVPLDTNQRAMSQGAVLKTIVDSNSVSCKMYNSNKRLGGHKVS